MRNLDLLIPKEAPKGGSWAWAKITTGYDAEGDYFVNVRLDGEDADLEATPVFLCDPEEFYDTGAGSAPQRTGRSLVQLLDGQVFVYGESGGLPRAPADKIAAGEYDARSGRILWSHSGGPAMHVGDGGTSWWDFAPTEGGTTAWRTTFTGYFVGGPPVGTTFYDTTLSQLMAWSGSAWVALGPYVPPTGLIRSNSSTSNSSTSTATSTEANICTATIASPVNGRKYRASVAGLAQNNTAGEFTTFNLKHALNAGVSGTQFGRHYLDQRAANRTQGISFWSEFTYTGTTGASPYNVVLTMAASNASTSQIRGDITPMRLVVDEIL